MHFICPMCGVKAQSGKQKRGYKLRLTDERVLAASRYLGYTLEALQLISLMTSVPLPHLADLAAYLPSKANVLTGDLNTVLLNAKEILALVKD